eukprot:6193572-Pleurochrysis_carterae.AAC.4
MPKIRLGKTEHTRIISAILPSTGAPSSSHPRRSVSGEETRSWSACTWWSGLTGVPLSTIGRSISARGEAPCKTHFTASSSDSTTRPSLRESVRASGSACASGPSRAAVGGRKEVGGGAFA